MGYRWVANIVRITIEGRGERGDGTREYCVTVEGRNIL